MLDEIKAISAQLSWSWAGAELGKSLGNSHVAHEKKFDMGGDQWLNGRDSGFF